MDSVLQLTRHRRCRTGFFLALLIGALAGMAGACTAERLAAREVLADPLMRFSPGEPISAPGEDRDEALAALPTNTIEMRVSALADPGVQVGALRQRSSIRAAVEIAAGFGLEAGYGQTLEQETILKLDGFAGPLAFERLRHGPDAALVYDDGTSVLRAGYGFRTAFDGDEHRPQISARTLVLGSDTVVELGYQRIMTDVVVSAGHLPAAEAVDAQRNTDRLYGALEQGFLPGINLRLEVEGRLESGFLQSPYRLVTLWSHRPIDGVLTFEQAPVSKPERHPDSRVRFGGLLRTRFAIPAWAAALELDAGYGSGTWRVEHAQAGLAWLQRIGDKLTLELMGSAHRQTRAIFYRDDYPLGPVGRYWSADRSLSAYLAWQAQLALAVSLLPERGRLLAMFEYLNLEFGARVIRTDYNFEGLDTDNGFSSYPALAPQPARQPFDGGWQFGGWFGLVAGF